MYHLEPFLYISIVQRGRKLEGCLSHDPFQAQGLEDGKSKIKHLSFADLLYLSLNLVIAEAGRGNMKVEVGRRENPRTSDRK